MEDDSRPTDSCDCEPFVYMPAWWSSFLFQLISPRQLAVYTYLAMLGVQDGVSRPTARQIQQDMGLSSDSVVFDALRVLEELGLIRRLRAGGAKNAYVRPACESTLVRLLELELIDSRLRPAANGAEDSTSEDVLDLARDGLRQMLGKEYSRYENAPARDRRTVLLQLLRDAKEGRKRSDRTTCVCELDEQ